MSRNTNSVTQSALKDTKTSKRSRADIIIARAYPLEEGGSDLVTDRSDEPRSDGLTVHELGHREI